MYVYIARGVNHFLEKSKTKMKDIGVTEVNRKGEWIISIQYTNETYEILGVSENWISEDRLVLIGKIKD